MKIGLQTIWNHPCRQFKHLNLVEGAMTFLENNLIGSVLMLVVDM